MTKKSTYNQWKAKYYAQLKIDKRNQIVASIAAVIAVGLLSWFFYLYSTDELKFIGHNTDYTQATVKEIELKYGYRGHIYQLVKYEFVYENEDYSGYFRGTKVTGRHFLGDIVKIKFAMDDPTVSKRIATVGTKYYNP